MITGGGTYTGQIILTAHGEICFYCGKATEDPAIVWVGSTAEIILHPRCAVELTLRISRDVHQLECERHVRLALVADGEITGDSA